MVCGSMRDARYKKWVERGVCTIVYCQLLYSHAALAADSPKLNYLFPGGASRGTTITLDAGGEFQEWPVSVLVYGKDITVEAAEDQGKLNLVVEPDAQPGVRWLRVYDQFGASSLRSVIVGSLPELVEQEPNDAPLESQNLARSSTVNGRLEKKGDVDSYVVQLQEGQTLVADMLAHRTLASPMDAVLQLCTSAGLVLKQNDDECGLDPRLVFTAPHDGTYLVRTFAFPAKPNANIAFSGADSYVYRLTITTDGFVDHALPMALSPLQTTSVQLFGWNLTNSAKTTNFTASANHSDSLAEINEMVCFPEIANTLPFSSCEGNNIIADPSSDASCPQSVDVPVTITGRIENLRDRDSFRFRGKEGQTLAFRVESRSLSYLLDPVLQLTDAKGKVLKDVDDTGGRRDAAFEFEVPSDDEYQLTIFDLHGHGGFRYVYRITIEVAEPDFELMLNSSSYQSTPDEPLQIPITVKRKHGFSAEIEISAKQLPLGVEAQIAKSLPNDDPKKPVQLTLKATRGGVSGELRITGTPGGSASRARTARYSIKGGNASHDVAWLTVLKSPETNKSSQ